MEMNPDYPTNCQDYPGFRRGIPDKRPDFIRTVPLSQGFCPPQRFGPLGEIPGGISPPFSDLPPPLNFRDFALLRFQSSYYWGQKEQRKDRPLISIHAPVIRDVVNETLIGLVHDDVLPINPRIQNTNVFSKDRN